MIVVRFFASLREQLGTGELRLALEASLTVDQLIEQLAAEHGETWRSALNAPQLIVAINQQVANRATRLVDGDELALFPPVTGG